jgi:hypothetical protein
MRLLAAIVAVPVLLTGWQLWSDHSFEQRLRPIASGVAGRNVEVDCQSFWGELIDAQGREGEVLFDASGTPERKLFLTRRTCKRLRAFAKHASHRELDCLRDIDWTAAAPLPFDSACYARSSDTIYAVLILAHESYHTTGVTDEATTNCFALQAMAWTAAQLGAPVEESELLARAMEALEPAQASGYGTTECHAGLRLDLHPETLDFPTEHPTIPPLGRGGSQSVVSEA